MSFSLIPNSRHVPHFTTNNTFYMAMLEAAFELCPEGWDAVRILNAADHSRPEDNYPHGWSGNNAQRVEAAGAAALGRALIIVAETDEARRIMLEQWKASHGERTDPDTDRQAADNLQARLRLFARFLQESGGFEIR